MKEKKESVVTEGVLLYLTLETQKKRGDVILESNSNPKYHLYL
jgi:hypothetical protein